MSDFTLSGLIALILTAAGALINVLYFRANGTLLFKVNTYGGEITIENGFGGVVATHIYGMTPDAVTTHHIRFNPIVFAISYLLAFVVIYIALRFILRRK